MTRAVTLAEIADSNTFIVDSTNNRVGIASTIPTTTLDVDGAVKATSFTGNVTGNATGLTGTPDIAVRNITGVAATFTGVLTYEDVTNIDSVGIVTARSGVRIGAGGLIVTAGVSTFAADATINSLTIGRGPGNVSTNTVVGSGALFSNASGSGANNTAIGRDALYENTSGASNTAIGRDALHKNTTGAGNVASGYQSLRSNTTASSNTATGYQSLYSNTTGTRNSAVGYQALYTNTTGNYNAAVGSNYCLGRNTTGSYNAALGDGALAYNTCLLYTSPSPRDQRGSRMPSSA